MLYRVFTPPGCGKKDYIPEKIKEAFLEDKRVFVLVPEQMTASFERKVVSLCGNRASERIEVTNFSRLPDVVLRTFGSLGGKAPTDAEKKLILAECLHHLKPSLSALSFKEDASSVEEIAAELEGMRAAGLTPAALARLSEMDLSSPDLSEKLGDVAVLSAAFSDGVKEMFTDPAEEGERLAQILTEYPFFEKSVVFIDGFWDFTYPQRLILSQILKQSEKVYVTFQARKKDGVLFQKPLLAARDLLRRAGEVNCPVEDISFDLPEENSPLSHLARHFGKGSTPFEEKCDKIELWSVKNAGEEAEHVANRILRLIREGASFGEIAVLSRDGAGEEILSLTLAEKGIPHFLEEKRPLCRTALCRTVLLACGFALGQGGESDVRSYIKNGVFLLSDEERFCLERYVSTWSLTPKKMMHPAPFTMNPEGYFTFEENSAEKRELDLVNKVKEKVFSPIRDLSLHLAAGKVEDRISAIIAFLTRIGTEKVLDEKIRLAAEKDDFEEVAALLGTWNSLLEALSAFGRTLGEKECDGERFLSLLDLALSGSLPGILPPGQDRVQIGRVNFSRTEETRYVFITGLSAGTFPAPEAKGGIFPRREKDLLRELGYPLPGGDDSIADEYFYFYLAALCGEKGLILSWRSEGGETENTSLSVIGKRMLTLFPHLEIRSFDPEKAQPLTETDAFRYLLKQGEGEKNEELKKYFLSHPMWKERFLSATAGGSFEEMRDRLHSVKPYENKDVNMVYSRLEKYTLCPFSYFSRYLLGAKTREKASIGANIAGTFVHNVLEKALLTLSAEKRSIGSLSDEEIAQVNLLAVKEVLADLLQNSAPESVLFIAERLKDSTLLILKHLQKEFSLSKFTPIFFEKSLGELEGVYKIPLKDQTSLCLFGDIDRVDLYRSKGGEDYVRVVDYKTGGHDFSLTDVGNGLSLQMLLYLFALWNEGFSLNGEKIHPLPAGVIYLNGLEASFPCDTEKEAESIAQDPYRALSREGLVVDHEELLSAQDPEGMGEFIPVAWGKKKVTGAASLISLEKLGKLKKKVEKDFARLAENLKDGEIPASPLVSRSGQVDPCRWCEYRALCKRKDEERRPYRSRISQSELFGEEV